MKKLLVTLFVMLTCFLAIEATATEIPESVNPYKLIVDTTYLNEASVKVVDGRTCVPLRSLLQATGATVEWQSETRSVILNRNGREISLTIDSNVMKTPEGNVIMDVAPYLHEGTTTYMPIRAICEAYNFTVEWDTPTRTILVRTPGGRKILDSNPGMTLEQVIYAQGMTPNDYMTARAIDIDRYNEIKDMLWIDVTEGITLSDEAKAAGVETSVIKELLDLEENLPDDTLWVDIVNELPMFYYIAYLSPVDGKGLSIEDAFDRYCKFHQLGHSYKKVVDSEDPYMFYSEYSLYTKYKFIRCHVEETQFLKGNFNYWEADQKAQNLDISISLTASTIPFTFEMKDGSKITGVLYPDVAPESVNYFITLANEGFYNGLVFHYLKANDNVQTGYCLRDERIKTPQTRRPVRASSILEENQLPFEEGLLSFNDFKSPYSGDGVISIVIGTESTRDNFLAFGKVDEKSVDVLEKMIDKTHMWEEYHIPVVYNNSIEIKKVTIGK